MSGLVDVMGMRLDPSLALRELDRVDCEDNLYTFLKQAWRHIDPAPWTDGWPIEAIAEHLQAVADGDIRKLIINVPPRCGKSSLVSVAFPAWIWAQTHDSPTSGPSAQILAASYANQLALRDSVKCRRLIASPWYQSMWGDRFTLNSDQNTKGRFSNDKGGERLITSVSAAVTGEGANCIIIDDANSASEAYSEAAIYATNEWWDGTMSTRLNDKKRGAFINIQQRLAENDLTGHLIEKEVEDWTLLVLPMHYDPSRSFVTSIGWEDPRKVEGELLWPERMGEKEVKDLERSLMSAASGQLEQSPQPVGGGVIKRDMWQLWEEKAYPPMDYVIASLDTAYTLKTTNDFSALSTWGVFTGTTSAQATRRIGRDGRVAEVERTYVEGAPSVMMMHAWQERLEFHDLVEKTVKTCRALKVDCLLIENKAAGHSVAQEIRRLYNNELFSVLLYDPKSLDKLSRLYSIQHLFAEGMVWAPDKIWADTVITQVGQFPKGKHDDLVDTVSMAIRHLRDMGLLQRGQERLEDMESEKTYPNRSDMVPLYPG